MTSTPDKLVALAKVFTENQNALDIPPAAPGSMIGLWLSSAAALGEALAENQRLNRLIHDDDLALCREALNDSEAEVTRLVSGLRKVYALAETEHETLDRAGISDAAFEALMDTGHDIYDDGAPQDGGVTDPHDTSAHDGAALHPQNGTGHA